MRTEVITAVDRSVKEGRNESIRHRAQSLKLCLFMWKTLQRDLGLRAYKIQVMQKFKSSDHYARRKCDEKKIQLNPLFQCKICI